MLDTSFRTMVRHIATYLQRVKEPDAQTLSLWHRSVDHIPDEAISFIRDYICNNRDMFPKNIPRAIKEAYQEYKKSNNYQMTYEEKECNECFGFGYLMGLKYQIENGIRLPYRTLYRCAACQNWERQFGLKVPGATYSQMLGYGYDVIDNRKPPITSKTAKGKIKYKYQLLEMEI